MTTQESRTGKARVRPIADLPEPWETAWVRIAPFLCALGAFAAAACGRRAVEVDHPFYLMFIEDPREVALFRCPNGPDSGAGCAMDGLPGPRVTAAGANARFVVVARQPGAGGPTLYYYFARVPEETRGWGNNPERIVGPLDEDEFEAAKARLRLPEFTVRW